VTLFYFIYFFQNGACPFNSNIQEEVQIKKKIFEIFVKTLNFWKTVMPK